MSHSYELMVWEILLVWCLIFGAFCQNMKMYIYDVSINIFQKTTLVLL